MSELDAQAEIEARNDTTKSSTQNNPAAPSEAENLQHHHEYSQTSQIISTEQPTEAHQTENNQSGASHHDESSIMNDRDRDRDRDRDDLDEEPDGEILGLPVPPIGTELFLGGLSRDIKEEDIRSAFAVSGKIFSIRVVRDRATGECRGFGFVTFVNKEAARQAVKDHHEKTEIKGRLVRVTMSESKSRLFLGNLPREMQKSELEAILTEDGSVVRSLEWLPDAFNPKRNRGFAFVEFASHQDATQVLKRFQRTSLQGISASWAEPKDEVDDEIMETVKTIYVRNLPTGFTEGEVSELFSKFGPIEKVVLPASTTGQKWKNFGFVYFEERQHALDSIAEMDQQPFRDRVLEVSLARPIDANRGGGGGDRGGRGRGGDRGGYGARGHRGGGRGQFERGGGRHYGSSRSDHYAPPQSRYDDHAYPSHHRERERYDPYPDPYPRESRYPPQDMYPPTRSMSPSPAPILDPYARGASVLPPQQQTQRSVYYWPATGQLFTTNASGQLVPMDPAQARQVDFSTISNSAYAPPPNSRYESRYERTPPPAAPAPRYRPY
eukprot:c7993_g1_i1.p1 GENE.c7993_g1_i1~~c7993_g1_i1.p1  ORF type:complete len:552 (+),score=56.89 c7993_g1_i1:123-1778(+)